jgi:hypothetical protein
MEKSISLLLFPLFILGNYKRVQFIKLLQFYSYTTTAIVLFFFIRFIVVYPDLINKYLGGDLWEWDTVSLILLEFMHLRSIYLAFSDY